MKTFELLSDEQLQILMDKLTDIFADKPLIDTVGVLMGFCSMIAETHANPKAAQVVRSAAKQLLKDCDRNLAIRKIKNSFPRK